MPSPTPGQPQRAPAELHRERAIAESFGREVELYDRARPAYPDALVQRVVNTSPGPDLLDVGCGTGIATRQFRAAGCSVLGVEPDNRMAEFTRADGLPVEVARFEDWNPAARTFDMVIAAQSWHWVDPTVGAAKAAQILRPSGQLAIFGHLYEPPIEVAEPFASALRRAAPDSPFASMPARRPVKTYQAYYAKIADTIRATGQFAEPDEWRFDWEQHYTRDQWLALLPTTGGLTRLTPKQQADVLAEVGAAIDDLGGAFTMYYTTLATTASRTPPRRG